MIYFALYVQIFLLLFLFLERKRNKNIELMAIIDKAPGRKEIWFMDFNWLDQFLVTVHKKHLRGSPKYSPRKLGYTAPYCPLMSAVQSNHGNQNQPISLVPPNFVTFKPNVEFCFTHSQVTSIEWSVMFVC